jgi:hypothetical protein
VINWEWSIPKISGKFPEVTPHAHKANLVDNYMIVTFGNLSIFVLNINLFEA